MLEGEKGSNRIHFGPRTLRTVPLVGVHELQQVRTSYDPEGIEELATSMVLNPELDDNPEQIASEAFDLNNPIIVARFTDEFSTRRYIHDYAEHYDIEPVDAHAFMAEDETATILIAGHRRKRAFYRLAEKFNIDPEEISVSASVYEDISFAEALRLQLSENVHERPPVHDEARAIERFYRDVTRQQGAEPSKKAFAAQLGFSETKVRDALAFASLPREIQDLTEQQLLSYSIVKRFKPLQDAYTQLHQKEDITDDELSERVLDSLMIDAHRLLNNRLDNSEVRAASYLDNVTQAVVGQLQSQEALFELTPETPKKRRDRAARQLSKTALQSLEWQAKSGDLDEPTLHRAEELRDRLDELVRNAKQYATDAPQLNLEDMLDQHVG